MTDLGNVLAFSAIASALVVSPGPNLFLLLRNTPAQGRRTGLVNVLGVALGIFSHACLSLFGVSAIIVASAVLFTIVKLLGAAYLVWLGLTALRGVFSSASIGRLEPVTQADPKVMSFSDALAQGWLSNILNPKPALFYLAAFPQFLNPSAGSIVAQGLTLACIHVSIAAGWYCLIVAGVERARQMLGRPRVRALIRAVSGTALLTIGLRLAFLRAPGAS